VWLERIARQDALERGLRLGTVVPGQEQRAHGQLRVPVAGSAAMASS
jgi:hypothetical protein